MAPEGDNLTYSNTRARIAVYDDLRSSPRIVDIEPGPTAQFIADIANKTYELSQGKGGKIPFTVINEIAENFIHAYFAECTVSILNNGNLIRFSDQGQGIEKKDLVLQPGVTSASSEMKRFIKGVGSGFPIVKEYLDYTNGYLSIDDNATHGTVVTISIEPQVTAPAAVEEMIPASSYNVPLVSEREVAVLKLIYARGIIGPSDINEVLGISVATAYRDLTKLEEKRLVEPTSNGKRILSNAGLAYVQTL
jgi:uncharacterized membrane protein